MAANVFLLGFLLAGTLSDFKESERLPGDLAASIESIADECDVLDRSKGDPVATELVGRLAVLEGSVTVWIERRGAHADVLAAIRRLNRSLLALEPLVETTFINRLKNEQAAIRRIVLRMHSIRTTSFVRAGYLIAEVTAALVIVALLLTDIGPAGEATFFVGVIAFCSCT